MTVLLYKFDSFVYVKNKYQAKNEKIALLSSDVTNMSKSSIYQNISVKTAVVLGFVYS